jgi:exosome complex component RRP42
MNKFPGVHFLDATTQEEAALPMRLILIFSFPTGSPAALHGMHLLGTGETDLAQIESLVKVRALVPHPTLRNTQVLVCPQEGGKYASDICSALSAKLKDEDIRRTEKAQIKFSAARR